MEYRLLGSTQLRISRVGFGCWAMGGHGWGQVDDDLSIAAVRQALDLGINFFDTADVYGFGHSEEILSKALGDDRHKVVIATKFGVSWDATARIGRNASPDYMVKALENSLRRLRIDSIPLYQIHWPDESTPIEATMEALLKCQEAGKIRHIGCSNFPPSLLRVALRTGRLESLQAPYSLIRREIEGELLDTCIQAGVSVLSYDVLAKGLLTGKFGPGSTFGSEDVRSRDPNFVGDLFQRNLSIANRLRSVGSKCGKTPAQVAIRWVLEQPGVACAITGVKEPGQIRENAGALGWNLAPEDFRDLSVLTQTNLVDVTGERT